MINKGDFKVKKKFGKLLLNCWYWYDKFLVEFLIYKWLFKSLGGCLCKCLDYIELKNKCYIE